jgi:rare lipoprotein A
MSGPDARRWRWALAAAGVVVLTTACTAPLPPAKTSGQTTAEQPGQLPATTSLVRPTDPLPGLPELATMPPDQALAALKVAPRRQVIETGTASWYGPGFAGRPTASGEIFDPNELTAAHPELPLGSEVVVVNLENGREARLRINDRGPFVEARVIDVSRAAARHLGFYYTGLAEVRVELIAAPPGAVGSDA